ncbi:MAG: hypothetical protein JWP74_1526 [Marmoricola sp.]|nr:hypothetical protein [Marmoricola sp.]
MTTPAGWFDDGSGTRRYWDGAAWTDRTEAQLAPPLDAAAVPSRQGVTWPIYLLRLLLKRPWPTVAGAALVAVLIVAFVGLRTGNDGPDPHTQAACEEWNSIEFGDPAAVWEAELTNVMSEAAQSGDRDIRSDGPNLSTVIAYSGTNWDPLSPPPALSNAIDGFRRDCINHGFKP